MTRGDRFVLITMLLASILIVFIAIYGMIAHFLIIPDKDSRIKVLEMRIETYQEIVKQKDSEIEELRNKIRDTKLIVRWDKFLQLMMDKDTRVRFDGVEKYLKKNRKELFQPLKIGG